MSEVVLVASIPWGEDSFAPLPVRRYPPGGIAPLARRIVPLVPWPDPERRPHDARVFAKVVRGRATQTGYRLEVVADDTRPDAPWLLNEVTTGFAPYVVPDVVRARLMLVAALPLETWPSARLVRSPLPLQPITALDRSPLPDRPATILDPPGQELRIG